MQLFFARLVAAATVSAMAALALPSNIVSYTSETFKDAIEAHIAEGRVVMVAFYAPWCGHSKKFLPIYEEISDEFEAYNNDNDNDNEVEDGVMKEKKKTTTTKRKLNDFVFAKVDCVKETSLYSSEHIEHFPSIKTYLAGGEGVMYEEDREKPSIIRHIRLMGSSSLIDINAAYNGSLETFQYEYLTAGTPVAVLFSDYPATTTINDDGDGDSAAAAVMRATTRRILARIVAMEYACKRMSYVACGVVYSGNGNSNNIAVIRNFTSEESIVYFGGDDTNGTSIYSFFQRSYYPVIAEMRKENEEQMFSHNRVGFHTHCLLVLDTSVAGNVDLLTLLSRDVASREAFFGRLIFVHIDPSVAAVDKFVGGILGGLKLKERRGPTVVIVESKKKLVNFWYLNELTDVNVDSVGHFVDDVLFNKAKPTRTSYPEGEL